MPSFDNRDNLKAYIAPGAPLPGGRYGYIDVAAIPGVAPEVVSMPPPPAWKQRDEEELREVRARLAELEARRAHAVEKVADVTHDLHLPGMSHAEFVTYMIDRADEIRDALAPFDSGVRDEEAR